MNIARARELLIKAARELKGSDSVLLEEAAITFARVKQRNANRRDRWKVRKRLTISRVGVEDARSDESGDCRFDKSV